MTGKITILESLHQFSCHRYLRLLDLDEALCQKALKKAQY